MDSPHNAVKKWQSRHGGGNNHSTPNLSVPFPRVPRKDYLADGRSPTPRPVRQAYLIHFIYFFYAYVSDVVRKLSACRGKLGHHPLSNEVYYAMFRSRSHRAVIRVYDDTDNVIETREHAGDFKEW